MRVVSAKDRDFNPVKAGRFDLFEIGIVLLGYVRRPEKQVHADFHYSSRGGASRKMACALVYNRIRKKWRVKDDP